MTSTTPESSLGQSLREAAERTDLFRRTLATAQARYAEAEAAFDAQHGGLIAEITSAKALVEEAEFALRSLAVTAFQATGERKPCPGIEIGQTTVAEYDEVKALAWARENAAALKLDRAGFERIAKAMPLPFVTLKQVPKATLAKDLGAALAAAQEAALATESAAEEVV